MMGWEYVDHTYANLCIHVYIYIYTLCVNIYICMYPQPAVIPYTPHVCVDISWQSWLGDDAKSPISTYPLIFQFYVHIHTCMHTYKNGYSPQMLFHLPECAYLLVGPGHGQLQRDGFLTLLFKVYAIQRWVKATKNGRFATTCWFRQAKLSLFLEKLVINRGELLCEFGLKFSHIRPTCLNSNVEPKHDSFQQDNKDIL